VAQTDKRVPKRLSRNELDGLSGVILLAFGPRPTTRSAEKSLRKMCPPGVGVLTIPALGVATATTTRSTPGGVGGLDLAISSLAPGPVLVVHDDVAIDSLSVARLLEAHRRGATVAVPATNDRGTDHFFGSLPPAVSAHAQLRKLALEADHRVAPIVAARPGCLLADALTLAKLVSRRIHDPFTLLNDQGLGIFMVSDAIAAHDGSCGRRVRSAGESKAGPILVASMIVKDEEEMLPGCLESLEGLVDRVEIVDTGSSDNTVDVATSHGANVSYLEWADDFSLARNFAADRCRDSMFTLWVDADERLKVDDPSLVRDLLAAYRDEFEALDISIANYRHASMSEVSSTFRAARIVRSTLLGFSGRIHETPVREGEGDKELITARFDLVGIDHLGYIEEVVDERGKRERNLGLARAQHDEAGTIKASVDLARSLMLSGDSTDEAIALLRDAVDAATAAATRDDWMAYLLGSLAHLLLQSDEAVDAYELSSRAFGLLPSDDLSAAVLGRSSLAVGKERELIAAATHGETTNSGSPVFESPDNRRIFDVSVVMARAAVGETAEAWESVLGWSERGHVFNEQDWEGAGFVAVRAFAGMELLDQLVTLAAAQQSAVGLLGSISSSVAPELTALIAVGVLATGSVAPDAVLTGALAAMVSSRWDLFDEFGPYFGVLDIDVRRRLAARLDEKGEHTRADAVLSNSTAPSSLLASFGGGRD